MICYCKVRENPDLPVGQSYEITQIDKGFLVNQPGLHSVVVPYCSCCLYLYFGSAIMLVTYFVNFR